MDSLLMKCKSQWKVAFIGTFVVGILCYFYFLSNHFLTYDSMWNLYSDQNMIASGRQFLKYACSFSSYYDLPAVNGLLSIFYLALTAVVMVEIFDIKNNLCALLTGAFLVTFPSIISTFAYNFTVDGYMLAILLTTLAFWLTSKYRWGFLIGAVLAGIGIGIYQAYFAYLIVLCIIKLLLDLLREDHYKILLSRIVSYLLMGGLAYLFYGVSLKIMLVLQKVSLSGYQGTEKVLEFSFRDIPRGLKTAFDSFYQFLAWSNVLTTTNLMKLSFIVLAILGISLYGYYFICHRCYKNIFKIVLAILLIAVLPFGLNIICILSPDTYMHLLIRYAWVLLFVFVFVLADRLEPANIRTVWLKSITVLVLTSGILMVSQFMIVANIAAFNMEERYEKTYALCVRIVDRLEQTEGYKTGDKVAILGGEPNESNYPPTSITQVDLSGYFGVSGEYTVNSTEKFATFCAHYLNVSLQTVDAETEISLANTAEYQNMTCFPDNGCLKQINGVWVIKLNG